jgi:CheY-like chemotaxis protein
VLLVEDDALIRMDAFDMLQALGYEVLEAEYGPDALVLLRERHIDVLVTDVGLPGMSGTELADRARKLHPDIVLVFATGDTELESREGRPGAAVLCKPYDAASLAESLHRALARS